MKHFKIEGPISKRFGIKEVLLKDTPKQALCFGLPGTGKSTFVKSHTCNPIVLDLGHNAFKSEEERERFYRKCIKHTTTELDVLCRVPDMPWLYDTYPEYFDISEVADHGNVKVIFAIPSVGLLGDVIVPRVFERDGDTEFPRLYKKMYKKWYFDWCSTFERWYKVLGKKRCCRIPTYDSVDWYRTWKC